MGIAELLSLEVPKHSPLALEPVFELILESILELVVKPVLAKLFKHEFIERILGARPYAVIDWFATSTSASIGIARI